MSKSIVQHNPIRHILSDYFSTHPGSIIDAPLLADMKESTDLIAINQKKTIAARIRKAKFFSMYPDDITIRATDYQKPYKNEWQKIFDDGHCDLYFYGFEHPLSKNTIKYWRLISLDIMRQEYKKNPPLFNSYLANKRPVELNGRTDYLAAINMRNHKNAIIASNF